MCYELMSYWSAYANGFYPGLFDTTSHNIEDGFLAQTRDLILQNEGSKYAKEAINLIETGKPLFVIYPLLGKESAAATIAEPELLDSPALCELEVKEVTVPNCLDLRLESHREFFCGKVVAFDELRAHETWTGTRHHPTVDFIATLSAMMYPEPGGDLFHQQVGQRLRTWGYDGFVFPSARDDHKIVNIGDDILEHRGWNFVDYRGAKRTRDVSEGRVRKLIYSHTLASLGVQVFIIDKHDVAGKTLDVTGYLTDGVAAQEWHRIEYELGLMAQGIRPGFFDDRFRLREDG
jgi:hypothetical protein